MRKARDEITLRSPSSLYFVVAAVVYESYDFCEKAGHLDIF